MQRHWTYMHHGTHESWMDDRGYMLFRSYHRPIWAIHRPGSLNPVGECRNVTLAMHTAENLDILDRYTGIGA